MSEERILAGSVAGRTATDPKPLLRCGTPFALAGRVRLAITSAAGKETARRSAVQHRLHRIPGILFCATLGLALSLLGCGGAGSSAASPSTPPPAPGITVSVLPTSAQLFLGQTQNFSATVAGTANPDVNWSVNGIPGGNAVFGTITSGAVYTAPQALPASVLVTITATSVANPSSSGSATVKLESDITVSLLPSSAQLALGVTQSFTASVSGSGNPSGAVTWNLSGAGCSGAACGGLSSTGPATASYTAPTTLPSPPQVTLTATSVADPSRSAAASVTLVASCSPAISISPAAASVALGEQQALSAIVCFSANQTVNWAIPGVLCSGTVCGAVSSTGPSTAAYIAPPSLPPADSVLVQATSQADPSQSATATITIFSDVFVSLSPASATLALNHRQTFSAAVANTPNQAVTWSVNGVANGSASVGEICITGSNPCLSPTGPAAGSVDLLAPASLPPRNPVTITASSAADASRSANAEVTILSNIQVSVWPADAFLAPLGTAEFTAIVLGTSNQAVSWQISCPAASCGSISPAGIYATPAAAPSPNAISVAATSQDEPSQSAAATVAISSAVAIEGLVPASLLAGAAASFTLKLEGLNFIPSSPGPGSAALFKGAARATNCPSAFECTITIDPSDVAAAGSLSLQVKNPDGTLSNPVALVVASGGAGGEVISLSASQPVAAGKDIIVVEPTTAGSDASPLDVLLLGLLDSSGTTCNLGDGAIRLARPASGTVSLDLCLLGNGLDPTFSYAVSGPTPDDLSISNPRSLGGVVALMVTLSSSTAPGARSLFVADPNNNRAAASGAIEVK